MSRRPLIRVWDCWASEAICGSLTGRTRILVTHQLLVCKRGASRRVELHHVADRNVVCVSWSRDSLLRYCFWQISLHLYDRRLELADCGTSQCLHLQAQLSSHASRLVREDPVLVPPSSEPDPTAASRRHDGVSRRQLWDKGDSLSFVGLPGESVKPSELCKPCLASSETSASRGEAATRSFAPNPRSSGVWRRRHGPRRLRPATSGLCSVCPGLQGRGCFGLAASVLQGLAFALWQSFAFAAFFAL